MALTGAHAPGATPLTEEDIRGLKLASVTTQGELNEVEAQNILRGQEWALRSRTRALSDMLMSTCCGFIRKFCLSKDLQADIYRPVRRLAMTVIS
jgi:hypothetical protein